MKLLTILSNLLPTETAYAHCDIPCGIYDPNQAQLAAHTVLRMIQLLDEHSDSMHDVARIVKVKEKHGDLVEDSLGTLENDYFKPEHFEKFPELKGLISDAVQLSIKTRQKPDMKMAEDMLEKVLLISEIFYKTKGVTRKFVVRDSSMMPALQDGEQVLVIRFLPIHAQDIIVFKHESKYLIKRVKEVRDNEFYVLGDNAQDSLDSRKFGWVKKRDIIGKVFIKL